MWKIGADQKCTNVAQWNPALRPPQYYGVLDNTVSFWFFSNKVTHLIRPPRQYDVTDKHWLICFIFSGEVYFFKRENSLLAYIPELDNELDRKYLIVSQGNSKTLYF